MHLSKLNGITATIVACLNCQLCVAAISDKLIAKYGLNENQAHDLIIAVRALG